MTLRLHISGCIVPDTFPSAPKHLDVFENGEASYVEVWYHICFILSTKDVSWSSAAMPWLQKNVTGNLLSTDDTVSKALSALPSVSLALLIIYFFAFGIPSVIYFFAFGIPSFIYFFAFGIRSFIYGTSLPSVSLTLFISLPLVSPA